MSLYSVTKLQYICEANSNVSLVSSVGVRGLVWSLFIFVPFYFTLIASPGYEALRPTHTLSKPPFSFHLSLWTRVEILHSVCPLVFILSSPWLSLPAVLGVPSAKVQSQSHGQDHAGEDEERQPGL